MPAEHVGTLRRALAEEICSRQCQEPRSQPQVPFACAALAKPSAARVASPDRSATTIARTQQEVRFCCHERALRWNGGLGQPRDAGSTVLRHAYSRGQLRKETSRAAAEAWADQVGVNVQAKGFMRGFRSALRGAMRTLRRLRREPKTSRGGWRQLVLRFLTSRRECCQSSCQEQLEVERRFELSMEVDHSHIAIQTSVHVHCEPRVQHPTRHANGVTFTGGHTRMSW